MIPSSPAEARRIGSKKYFTGIPCKRGHVAERDSAGARCVMCVREQSFARSLLPHVKERNARNKTKDNYREKQKAYSAQSRSYKAQKQSFVVSADLPEDERKRVYARMYYHANKNKMKKPNAEKRRSYARAWAKQFRKDPYGAAISFMRKCLSRCLANKTDRTELILGFRRGDLVAHIESLFQPGMDWGNYGDWHIDHIVPISFFVAQGETSPRVINALANLRPLWASENLSKGKKHDAL